jgi:hypothetical protein
MSEGDWSSAGTNVAPPKRGVPGWVWGCGGGCALFLLVGVVLAVFAVKKGKQFFDPETNWAAIGEVLPVVERPEGYIVVGFPFQVDGARMWMLTSTDQSDQHSIMIFHGSGGDAVEGTRRDLFGAGTADREDAELGTIVVQGRELTCLRHRTVQGSGSTEGWRGELMRAVDGANLTVDLSPPDGAEFLALVYTRPGSREPVPDEALLEFLGHFRLPAALPAPAPEVEPAPAEPVREPAADEEQDG